MIFLLPVSDIVSGVLVSFSVQVKLQKLNGRIDWFEKEGRKQNSDSSFLKFE